MSTAASPRPIARRFAVTAEKLWLQRLPSPALPVQPPAQVPPAPPQNIEPQRRRSHVLRNLALVAVLIAAVIVVAIALAGPSPQTSLEKAGTAFTNQDAPSFDNYVDVQSVLGDWTDQAAYASPPASAATLS